jgi:hypothetical protein
MSDSFVSGLIQNDQELLKKYANIKALAVRNEIEDFHVKHLTDAQMKELNPLIRNAIYNILFILVFFEKNEPCARILDLIIRSIPSYWETPELNEHLEKIHDEIKHKAIAFKSTFLNQQFQLGNIYYVPSLVVVQLTSSHDFKDVEHDERKRHKNKIINALRMVEIIHFLGINWSLSKSNNA